MELASESLITFSKLGQLGRLGNCLWQTAFLYSLANKYGVDWCVPDREEIRSLLDHFDKAFPIRNVEAAASLKEGPYRYQPQIFREHGNMLNRHVVDIEGYFQHMEYWEKPEEIKELFKFKPSFTKEVKETYGEFLKKPFIAVGVRRTDYVTTGNYYNIPPSWYLTAIDDLVTPEHNIIFISDDLEWCRFHFGCVPNTFFPRFSTPVEQLAFGTLADNWIIANSTFHWWSAFLSDAKRIIQPQKYFAGDLLRREGDYNFYNKEWEFNETEKVDLRDVTFTIPVKYDHADRKANLELIICLLQKSFETDIVVGEQGGEHFKYVEKFGVKYRKFDYEHFHRTKMLNVMALEADTDIIANWDADVMTPPAQIYEAVKKLRQKLLPSTGGIPIIQSGNADVVYPYDNLFHRIPKFSKHKIYPHYDLEAFRKLPVTKQDTKSVGGALLYNKEAFFRAGGENENFISYSPEDRERYLRFEKLGLRIERIPGNLYHFNHHIGPDSSIANPFYKQGVQAYDYVRGAEKVELEAHVAGWKIDRGY